MENQNNQQEQQLVQKKQNQKKNALFGIVALLIVAVIGGTIAYFSSTATFVNEFETATYKTVTTEVFESPDNWTPGETIPKTIATTNEGSIPVAVRVSYTETWEDLEGNTVQSPANAVTINFDNTTEWTKEGNYYYYNYKLNPNETTSSFISGVTLNNTASTVTCTPSQDGKTQTCEATDPALGKKYKLTITTETVQYDKYTEAWNTSLVIGDKPAPQPSSFATDDWSVIAANTTSSVYNVGDEKEIELDIDGDGTNETYHLVLVNNTTPAECSTEGFSQSTCGFVVQFKELLKTANDDNKKMNLTSTNVGGWPGSYMYTYLNDENSADSIYNKIKSEIGDIIIDTKTVSGYGENDNSAQNFISNNDKLYFFTYKEIGLGTDAGADYDSAADKTRKLDYYLEGINDEENNRRIKYAYDSTTKISWWLRSATLNYNDKFCVVSNNGRWDIQYSNTSYNMGISPAFRIGSN